jgi:hypothetical protein
MSGRRLTPQVASGVGWSSVRSMFRAVVDGRRTVAFAAGADRSAVTFEEGEPPPRLQRARRRGPAEDTRHARRPGGSPAAARSARAEYAERPDVPACAQQKLPRAVRARRPRACAAIQGRHRDDDQGTAAARGSSRTPARQGGAEPHRREAGECGLQEALGALLADGVVRTAKVRSQL